MKFNPGDVVVRTRQTMGTGPKVGEEGIVKSFSHIDIEGYAIYIIDYSNHKNHKTSVKNIELAKRDPSMKDIGLVS